MRRASAHPRMIAAILPTPNELPLDEADEPDDDEQYLKKCQMPWE